MAKMYRFVKNHPSRPHGLTPEKQTKLLTVVLESLHPDESELLLKLINKNLGVKGLTIKFVQEAYSRALTQETKLTTKAMKDLLEKHVNIYLSAEEAVKYGIADEVF